MTDTRVLPMTDNARINRLLHRYYWTPLSESVMVSAIYNEIAMGNLNDVDADDLIVAACEAYSCQCDDSWGAATPALTVTASEDVNEILKTWVLGVCSAHEVDLVIDAAIEGRLLTPTSSHRAIRMAALGAYGV